MDAGSRFSKAAADEIGGTAPISP